MKQNIIDVLAYLFNDIAQKKNPAMLKQRSVLTKLQLAGFEIETIYRTFDWLASLAEQNTPGTATNNSLRIFNPQEISRISREGRGFLLSLDRAGILNAKTREIVINQLMQLDQYKIDLSDIKWATLLVLMSQPETITNEQLRKFLLETTAVRA